MIMNDIIAKERLELKVQMDSDLEERKITEEQHNRISDLVLDVLLEGFDDVTTLKIMNIIETIYVYMKL